VSLRARIDKLMGRRPSVEEPPSIPDADSHNPPLPVLTPEEQVVKSQEQRKLLDEHDQKVSHADDDPPGGSVTP
jgi:hypothetical protein